GGGDVDVAVRGRKASHWGVGRMVVAFLRRNLLVNGPARRLEIQERQAGLDQRGLHPAALARSLAIEQGDQNALGEERAGHDIGDGNADTKGTLARKPRYRHDAAHALSDLVDRGPRGIGAVLAEAGNAAIDDARVALLDRLVVDA